MRSQTDFLLERAYEQVFQDLILGRAQMNASSTRQFFDALGGKGRSVFLAAFRQNKGFTYLEQFAVSNMLDDLLPAGSHLLTGESAKDLFALIDSPAQSNVENVIQRVCREMQSFGSAVIVTAVSQVGTLEHLAVLYEETQLLLSLSQEEKRVHSMRSDALAKDVLSFFDLRAIRCAQSYDELLFELCLAFSKMSLCGLTVQQQDKVVQFLLRVFALPLPGDSLASDQLAELLGEKLSLLPADKKDSSRKRRVLTAVYRHLRDLDVSLQSLAANELYMNADYLGRVFVELTGQHFSAFVEQKRVTLAIRLLQFAPKLSVSSLAAYVDYPANGQYFCKVFQRHCGMTPRDYRKSLAPATVGSNAL